MAPAPPRDKVILFRVTTEEHEQLIRAARAAKARSLSEYVRDRLLDWPRPMAAPTMAAVLEDDDVEANH